MAMRGSQVTRFSILIITTVGARQSDDEITCKVVVTGMMIDGQCKVIVVTLIIGAMDTCYDTAY